MQVHLGVVLEHDETGGKVLADDEEGHGGAEGVGRALWARSAGPPLLHRSSCGLVEAGHPPGEAVWPRPRCSSSARGANHPDHI